MLLRGFSEEKNGNAEAQKLRIGENSGNGEQRAESGMMREGEGGIRRAGMQSFLGLRYTLLINIGRVMGNIKDFDLKQKIVGRKLLHLRFNCTNYEKQI